MQREEISSLILEKLENVRTVEACIRWRASCPSHPDKKPSFQVEVGEDGILLHCHAGCSLENILEALSLTQADLFFNTNTRKTVTLEELAFSKRINLVNLMNYGLIENNDKTIEITYLNHEKIKERSRIRTGVCGQDVFWEPGTKDIIPYGLWRNYKNSERLFLVEGESDCWTLWEHGLDAIGFPGATMLKCLKFLDVSNVKQIIIINEGDTAGEKFSSTLKKSLENCTPEVFVLKLEGAKDPSELHLQSPCNFKESFNSQVNNLLFPPCQLEFITGAELQKKEFPPIKWAIPGLLPEGLTILAGRPKQGKSWLALNLAIAISMGSNALGAKGEPVEKGKALYVALEDNLRRLQSRISLIHAGNFPENLHLITELESFDEGGMDLLGNYLDHHPECRMIVLDTLAKIKGKSTNSGQELYQEDYSFMGKIQTLALERNVAIVIVHHTRKQEAEYALDSVSGSTALTGAADSIWVLKASPMGKDNASLWITGRDIEGEQDLALKMNGGNWELLGDSEDVFVTKERKEVLELLKIGPRSIRELSIALDKNQNAIKQLVFKLKASGKIKQDQTRGKYYI